MRPVDPSRPAGRSLTIAFERKRAERAMANADALVGHYERGPITGGQAVSELVDVIVTYVNERDSGRPLTTPCPLCDTHPNK